MTDHRSLAARFGTPLYVYDLDDVAAAHGALRAALPDPCELFYAFKANPHPDVARALREGGGRACGAEISSTGELAAARAAGYPTSSCLYTGPGKTRAELAEAVAGGVRLFSAESETDLRRIGAAADERQVVVDCLLRVNSPASAAATGLRMTGVPSRFGIDAETLPDALPRLLDVPGTRVIGAHFFPLSNADDEQSLVDEFRRTVEVAARLRDDAGLPLRFLDLGGGFAAPYGVPGERPAYPKLRAELEDALDLHLPGWREGRPRLAFESGRHLVGGSGSLVAEVLDVKHSRGQVFVVLDAGINAFGGLSGLGRLLPASVRPVGGGRGSVVATLTGPLCTPGDLLGRDLTLPDLAVGDVVAIPNAGAYGLTASLVRFLGREAPAEVVVRGDTVVSVSRLDHRREYAVTGPSTPGGAQP
ncbi:alanine racemase [Saccharothrix sp. 6-C]|uniref:alanine racemase n=1 Tax=Saccharothrix sp. 6-C TaxID=2781735 RepID=UPI0019175CA2|nr:alanine racemase [Saccharothrix sp. 6-C]QQQ78207.1 alanine racemase [Saccharothrix sp. 6-C]